jgi:GNAT superfamily N-acetyltransferase
MLEAEEKFFEPVFGIDQIRLQILGTHPAYRHRGFATALCQWGMKRAELDRVALTVMASPLGFELYSSLNFRDRGVQLVQVPGEDDKLLVHAMDFVPDSMNSGPDSPDIPPKELL